MRWPWLLALCAPTLASAADAAVVEWPAVDLAAGCVLWHSPLGTMQGRGEVRSKAEWVSPNPGGPIVTAGGVVFAFALPNP